MRVIEINPSTDTVIAVKILKDTYILQENEYETDLGALGQVRQSDGSFIDKVPTLTDIKNAKIAQLNADYQQALKVGFTVSVGGINYTCSCTADDLARLNATNTAITKGFETFPINYAAIDGTPIPLNSQADLDAIEEAATRFGFAQHKQILDLVGQVKAATTNANGEVDNIKWTTAAY